MSAGVMTGHKEKEAAMDRCSGQASTHRAGYCGHGGILPIGMGGAQDAGVVSV